MACRSSKDSPEYRAIHDNRVDLKEHLSTCLTEVADLLRQRDILSDGQYKDVMSHGCDKLLDVVLSSLKVDPLEFFVEFMDLLKQCGNKFFKKFLDTIEAERKTYYRKLFNVRRSPGSQAYDVFVSYSRQSDSAQLSDTIATRLTECGLRVFVDEQGIKPGDLWPAEIVAAINCCKAFVVLLSRDYVKGLYCTGELCEAEALHKHIFPVVCERGWDDGLAGQPVAKMVDRRQYAHLEGLDCDRELSRLVESIRECVSRGPAASGAVTQPVDTIDGSRMADIRSPPTELSLSDFLTKTRLGVSDDQLDSRIEQQQIPLVAACFDGIDLYMDALNLSPAEQTDVRAALQLNGTTVAMTRCLKLWISHATWNATFRTLLNVLLSLRREQVAYNVCQSMLKFEMASLSRGSSTDSEDQDEPSTTLSSHKDLLSLHTGTLCSTMDPYKMVTELRKQDLLTEHDEQVILAKVDKVAQNEGILDIVMNHRGPYAFHKFIRCLKSCGHTDLAYTLQPVRYRILWFASSPTLAAAVVYALENYHGFTFPDITDSKSPMVRRGTVFGGWHRLEGSEDDWGCVDDVEVCLVFPIIGRADIVSDAMKTALDVCPTPNIAVMSGGCDGVMCDGVTVIANKAIDTSSQLTLDPGTTDTLQSLIENRFKRSTPVWFSSFTETHSIPPQTPSVGCIGTSSDCVGGDTDSHLFYRVCGDRLSGRAVYFVCKGVVGSGASDDVKLTAATLSSTVTMEICSGLIDNLRQSR